MHTSEDEAAAGSIAAQGLAEGACLLWILAVTAILSRPKPLETISTEPLDHLNVTLFDQLRGRCGQEREFPEVFICPAPPRVIKSKDTQLRGRFRIFCVHRSETVGAKKVNLIGSYLTDVRVNDGRSIKLITHRLIAFLDYLFLRYISAAVGPCVRPPSDFQSAQFHEHRRVRNSHVSSARGMLPISGQKQQRRLST